MFRAKLAKEQKTQRENTSNLKPLNIKTSNLKPLNFKPSKLQTLNL